MNAASILAGILLCCGARGAAGADARGAPAGVAPVQEITAAGLASFLRDDPSARGGRTGGALLLVERDASALLAVTVDRSVLGTLRNGFGVDVGMGGRGGLHLNLYARRNPRGPGHRWNLNPAGAHAAARLWSLGGTLDLVRRDDGARRIVYVPQLLLDSGTGAGRPYRCQVALQYAYWRPGAGDVTREESVPQVMLRLRF